MQRTLKSSMHLSAGKGCPARAGGTHCKGTRRYRFIRELQRFYSRQSLHPLLHPAHPPHCWTGPGALPGWRWKTGKPPQNQRGLQIQPQKRVGFKPTSKAEGSEVRGKVDGKKKETIQEGLWLPINSGRLQMSGAEAGVASCGNAARETPGTFPNGTVLLFLTWCFPSLLLHWVKADLLIKESNNHKVSSAGCHKGCNDDYLQFNHGKLPPIPLLTRWGCSGRLCQRSRSQLPRLPKA